MASAIETPLPARFKTQNRWWWAPPLLVAVTIYLVLALWLARTKAPWCDEGQYANSSYSLAFHGRLASNVIEPSGIFFNNYFKGIQRRTYIAVPNQLIGLAAWFRLFGFSAFSARCYSICFGVLTLVALFYVLQRSFIDRRVAVIGTLFTSIDFIFLWSTADARMDAAANALALCSVAAYLYFRQRNLPKGILVSQCLAAAAVFTHPNSALVVLVTALLAWRFDGHRIRTCLWPVLVRATAPYLIFGCAWSLYIFRSPSDFRAQFFATVAGYHSERLTKILHPDVAMIGEIDRHFGAYCVSGLWGGVMGDWMVLIPLLYVPALIWVVLSSKRQEERLAIFTNYTVAMILGITFLNGFKGYFYLIYVLPLYNAVLAAWLLRLWRLGPSLRLLAVSLTATFVALQLSVSVLHIRADEYHRDYLPAVRELARDQAAGKSIVGTAALGFGLDYSGFKDDVRLGMYSGLNPDVIVMDRSYRLFASYFDGDEGQVFDRIVELLSSKYRVAAQYGSFWIFERVPVVSGKPAPPWLNVEPIKALKKGERSRPFFHLIFDTARLKDLRESTL